MAQGRQIIENYKKRWQLLRVLEAVCYGVGAGVFVGLLSQGVWFGVLIFFTVSGCVLLLFRPWNISVKTTSTYIDKHLQSAEYSTSLLLAPSNGLSGLAQLQQHKVQELVTAQIKNVRPKTGLKRALFIALALMVTGALMYHFVTRNALSGTTNEHPKQLMTFAATDSVAAAYEPPRLVQQKLTIRYPAYTRVAPHTVTTMNAKVVAGSRLFWSLDFNGIVRNVEIEGFGEKQFMKEATIAMPSGARFEKSITPTASGYYNFRFSDTLGASYASEIHAIEVIKDKAPEIAIKDIVQFTSFDYNDRKEFTFSTKIVDDYGVGDVAIIATVSKGSGESVKFREEKLAFDQAVAVGEKSMVLSKKVNLDQLKMEEGDELYFYVEARDLKTPRPNVARSETFFAVIKDTVTDGFGVEGTLGADLMPDYFRSQRQLIIDTEKLIKEQPQRTEAEFKSRSNELGFDQKSLRLKYGQFMGDEADSGIAVTPDISVEDFDEDDPTAGFRHDHDSDNEHNLVEDDHDHEEEHAGEEEGEEKSLLEGYVHNHDDPEESTLFTASLKGKLKQAMAEMWDAELYLRLANPKASLPYQYNALKLIQEIKNSARIYVHRIGFDPPPIKEDKRLSGDLDEIKNVYKKEDLDTEELYQAMRASIKILEDRIASSTAITKLDKEAFAKAGEELAAIAIKEPSKYLKTLQQLKWLTEDKEQPQTMLRSVQRGLFMALPDATVAPATKKSYQGVLEQLFMQELNARD